jgi:protein tyrosine phosphatase
MCVITKRRSKSYSLKGVADSDLTRLTSDVDATNDVSLVTLSNGGAPIKFPNEQPLDLSKLEDKVRSFRKNDDLVQAEFQRLSEFNCNLSTSHGSLSQNTIKNRYVNILPYDRTRVILDKKQGGDYINANYIQGYSHDKEYIACQGPLPHTIVDFWRMVWECGSEIIVMVTNPVENGNVKCEVYWPSVNNSSQYGNVSVTTISETIQPSLTVRCFRIASASISDKGDPEVVSRECTQYHFTTWPDMGVPNSPVTMLRFVQSVRDSITDNAKPVIIHCSAGVGRTGTFIALDVLLQRMQTHSDVNVNHLIYQMRSQRPSMVQTPAQYYFIFLCINYEYLYGETSFTKDTLSEHLERLQEAFPCTEDSRMDKEYEGALDIIIPGSLDIEIALSNEDKNRPGAGIPMDLNRVCLRDPLCSGDDYINASFIGCFGRKAEYIITQHPLKNTIEDFWKMILERHINSVVIIGAVSEQDEYWPGEEEFNFDGICVTLVDKYSEGYIEICSFEVEYEETEDYQKVTIFQLTSWPTKDDVPSETKSTLQ